MHGGFVAIGVSLRKLKIAFHPFGNGRIAEIERIAEHVAFAAVCRTIEIFSVARIECGRHFVDGRRIVVLGRRRALRSERAELFRLRGLALGIGNIVGDGRILPGHGARLFLQPSAADAFAEPVSELRNGRRRRAERIARAVFEHDFVFGGFKHPAYDRRRLINPARFGFRRLLRNPRKQRVETFVEVDVAEQIKPLMFARARLDDKLPARRMRLPAAPFRFAQNRIDNFFKRLVYPLERNEHPRLQRRSPPHKGDFLAHNALSGISHRTVGKRKLKPNFRSCRTRCARIDEKPAFGQQRPHARNELFLRRVSQGCADNCNLRCHIDPHKKSVKRNASTV